MSDLLENELVRKYFGYEDGCSRQWIAYNVLRAMQEPIRKGERLLTVHSSGEIKESEEADGLGHHWDSDNDWHPNLLRLPDRFQEQECEMCDDGPRIYSKPPLHCVICQANTYCWDHHDCKPEPPPCEHNSFRNRELCAVCSPKPKDPVEEKLQSVLNQYRACFYLKPNDFSFEPELRALVKLARETK